MVNEGLIGEKQGFDGGACHMHVWETPQGGCSLIAGGLQAHSPGIRELKVGEVEDSLAVGAVVIVHKFLQLHLAVLLLGDICHVHTSLRA